MSAIPLVSLLSVLTGVVHISIIGLPSPRNLLISENCNEERNLLIAIPIAKPLGLVAAGMVGCLVTMILGHAIRKSIVLRVTMMSALTTTHNVALSLECVGLLMIKM
jgi:hypothetical protein